MSLPSSFATAAAVEHAQTLQAAELPPDFNIVFTACSLEDDAEAGVIKAKTNRVVVISIISFFMDNVLSYKVKKRVYSVIIRYNRASLQTHMYIEYTTNLKENNL